MIPVRLFDKSETDAFLFRINAADEKKKRSWPHTMQRKARLSTQETGAVHGYTMYLSCGLTVRLSRQAKRTAAGILALPTSDN